MKAKDLVAVIVPVENEDQHQRGAPRPYHTTMVMTGPVEDMAAVLAAAQLYQQRKREQ